MLLTSQSFVQYHMRKQSTKALIAFAVIYFLSCLLLVKIYRVQVKDLLITFIAFGLIFPLLVWWCTGKTLLKKQVHFRRNETWLLLFLLLWIVAYTTIGIAFIDRLLPPLWITNNQGYFFVTLLRKLAVFVVVPFCIYRMLGFKLREWGFSLGFTKSSFKRNGLALLLLSSFAFLFEYFFSSGAAPLRQGAFSAGQLLKAVPLCFAWLLVEAGLVEEFFFRALLQTRLAAAFRSERKAIVVSALLFGLIHVPGLYLRSGSSEGMEEAMPLIFWIAYCIANMSLIAVGFGILWAKTRNLYFVMAVHAMFDLLPSLPSFIRTWHI